MSRQPVGRIILEGEEIEPFRLLGFDGVVLFEIVDGQYRIKMLAGEYDGKLQGDK